MKFLVNKSKAKAIMKANLIDEEPPSQEKKQINTDKNQMDKEEVKETPSATKDKEKKKNNDVDSIFVWRDWKFKIINPY